MSMSVFKKQVSDKNLEMASNVTLSDEQMQQFRAFMQWEAMQKGVNPPPGFPAPTPQALSVTPTPSVSASVSGSCETPLKDVDEELSKIALSVGDKIKKKKEKR